MLNFIILMLLFLIVFICIGLCICSFLKDVEEIGKPIKFID